MFEINICQDSKLLLGLGYTLRVEDRQLGHVGWKTFECILGFRV